MNAIKCTLTVFHAPAVLKRLLGASLAVLLLGALTALPALGGDAGAASHVSAQIHLPKSPLSGSVLVARAIHSGKLQPASPGTGITPLPQTLTCSPTPCALPNVQASEGGRPVNEDPIAANPDNVQQLLTGGNDFNCNSLLGFFASGDGGSTWNHTCMNTPAGFPVGCGDPGVGYDLTGAAYITGIASSSSSCFPGVITFERSTDNGTTWSKPAVAVTPLFSGGLTDKPWLQVDDNGPTGDCGGTQATFLLSRSTDGGKTWSAPVTIATVTLVPDPSGCCFFGQLPNTSERVSDIPVIGIDNSNGPHTGNLYAAFYTWTGSFMVVEVATSTTGGSAWGTPVRVTYSHQVKAHSTA